MELSSILISSLLKNSLLAIAAIAFIFALLGIFIIMKRMSFIGEGIAHSSLLAIYLAYWLSLNYFAIGIIWAIIFSSLIFYLEKKTRLPVDVLLIILFISSLSLGILLFLYHSPLKTNLTYVLFGNVFIINNQELLTIISISFLIALIYFKNLKKFLLTFLNKDIAFVDGLLVEKILFLFYLLLSIGIIIGIKSLGIILVNALLILPPAIAHLISNSFKSLIINSLLISEIIAIGGLLIAYFLNLPAGPTITLLGSLLFLLTLTIKQMFNKIYS